MGRSKGSFGGSRGEEQRRTRATEKIIELAARPSDLVTLWNETTEVLADAVPFYWAPCYYSLDPASLLTTSHYHKGLDQFPADWLANEYYQDDVNKLIDVATSPAGISTLFEATGGQPSSSPRWHANMSLGGDQELICRLRTADGQVWGMLGLYREPDRPLFDEADKRLLQNLAPHLAAAVRRGLLLGEATDPDSPDAPGLVVLDDGWQVISSTPGAERWLADLPDGDPSTGRLPSAVQSVAARALAAGSDTAPRHQVAVARVLSRSGTWVVLHGARMLTHGERHVAVIIEAATRARIFPLLVSAYGLTEREQEVTELVLAGSSTAEIATQLVISPHTVQQHLKAIFDKTGVNSRRDLVGRIFFTHYEPRFRDNETRTSTQQPLRGGPYNPSNESPSPRSPTYVPPECSAGR